jgi:hypothetical protein
MSFVTGSPRVLLRLEGLAVLIAAVVGYRALASSWWLFALLLLTPDLSIAGYLAGPRVGAISYNVVHTYVAPALLAVLAAAGLPAAWPFVVIWVAHIGMDRAVGFGLKYPSGFGDTHLGAVGRGR